MKKIALTTLLAFSLTSHADDWVSMSRDAKQAFDLRVGSYEERTYNGRDVYSVLFRYTDNKTQHVEVLRWNITARDCAKGYGTLFATDVNGEQYLFGNPFVFKAGTVASNAAEMLCSVHEKRVSNATL